MGDGHLHEHSTDTGPIDSRIRRTTIAIAVVLGIATLVGLILLWPTSTPTIDTGELGMTNTSYPATVTRVNTFECPTEEPLDPDATDTERADAAETDRSCGEIYFRLEEGPDTGEIRMVDAYDLALRPAVDVGDRIIVPYFTDSDGPLQYSPNFERERAWPMIVLAITFAALVIIQGRLRGLSALAGLVASIGVILVFVLPAIIEGSPPVLVAVVAASVIAYLALYLAHGFNVLTTVALLGTLASLILVTALSWLFTELTAISGVSEEVLYLRAFGGELDFGGLLLAGIILGSLGALDDMTVTQASAVAELHRADPTSGFSALYRSAIRIGRDHVASTVNTLALAYAGASLPLLLVFLSSNQSFGRILTSEVVATEIVRTLVGSIGLVASVPLTTALAARLVTAQPTVK
jgi:uncharacterized membrane protein